MAKVIMIATEKGGVGKTTITLELCRVLSDQFRVLAIDFDGQINLSILSGTYDTDNRENNGTSVFDVLCDTTHTSKMKDAIYSNGHYDVLNGDPKLHSTPALSSSDAQFYLQDRLAEVNDDYDYILIDCPPARGAAQEMAIVAADYVLLISAADDVMSPEGMANLIADIKLKKSRRISHAEFLGVIMNRYSRKANERETISNCYAIAQSEGVHVFDTVIRNSTVYNDAHLRNQSVTDYLISKNLTKSNQRLFDGYSDLVTIVNEIMERIELFENGESEGGNN